MRFIVWVAPLLATIVAANPKISLSDLQWTVSNNNNASIPGNFPSQAHLDLYRAGIIEDPLYGFNDVDQLWVQRSNWTWSTQSIKNLSTESDTQTWLIFEGLDTFAEVKLCDEVVANTNNMYRQYSIDVTDTLRKCSGSPDLSINFGSASKIVLDIAKTGPGKRLLGRPVTTNLLTNTSL